MLKAKIITSIFAILLFFTSYSSSDNIATNAWIDIPTFYNSNLVHAVIEIPAGTNEKWEFSKETGDIEHEIKNGSPRIVKYLGYPGNYGFIPQTILTSESGGDGDPFDCLVIGSSLIRGEIVRIKVIGMLKFLDNSEQDDKLIAVLPDSFMSKVNELSELNTQFPEALDIIRTWFENYKGAGEMKYNGIGTSEEAYNLIKNASEQFKDFMNYE